MIRRLARYRKSIAATVGGVLGWAGTAYVPDGHVDRAEWYGLAVVLATALGVYGVENARPGATVIPPRSTP